MPQYDVRMCHFHVSATAPNETPGWALEFFWHSSYALIRTALLRACHSAHNQTAELLILARVGRFAQSGVADRVHRFSTFDVSSPKLDLFSRCSQFLANSVRYGFNSVLRSVLLRPVLQLRRCLLSVSAAGRHKHDKSTDRRRRRHAIVKGRAWHCQTKTTLRSGDLRHRDSSYFPAAHHFTARTRFFGRSYPHSQRLRVCDVHLIGKHWCGVR